MTRVPHTARISFVISVMFVNLRRNMVSFELGREIEEDGYTGSLFRKKLQYQR